MSAAPAIPAANVRASNSNPPATPTDRVADGTGLAAFAGVRHVPAPVNEPVKSYAPGSPERKALKERLASMSA